MKTQVRRLPLRAVCMFILMSTLATARFLCVVVAVNALYCGDVISSHDFVLVINRVVLG